VFSIRRSTSSNEGCGASLCGRLSAMAGV
jgi:hypothetical protein